MDINLKTIIEAAIFAAGEPVSVERLEKLFEGDEQTAPPSKSEIKTVLLSLMKEYENHPIALKETASGFCFQVRPDFSPWINKLWQEKPPRASRALLETIAIIAYRQPITKGEIEEIRGVSVSSNILKTLLENEWIRISGQKQVPGTPNLYVTTDSFLDHFNLKSLSELPTLLNLDELEQKHETDLKNAALGETKSVQ